MLINARKVGRNVVTLKQMDTGFEVAWNGEVIAVDSDYDFAFQKISRSG